MMKYNPLVSLIKGRIETAHPPPDSPNIQTLFGSPLKFLILLCIHSNAQI